MQPTAKIIVQEHADQPTAWRRFVAVLCFIWFYVEFVRLGNLLWSEEFGLSRGTAFEPVAIAIAITLLVVYLCGRSLWYGQRGLNWLLPITAALLAMTTALAVPAATHGFSPSTRSTSLVRITLASNPWIDALGTAAVPSLPFLLVLMAAALIAWRPSQFMPTVRRPWVVLAIIWIIGAAAGCFGHSEWSSTIYNAAGYYMMLYPAISFFVPPLVVCGPFILTAFLLYHQHPLARSIALLMAGMQIGVQFYWADLISDLVRDAIIALQASAPQVQDWHTLPHPFGFYLMNQFAFTKIFVDSVFTAGPWLLIAVFAWRVPMTRLPEDGSPFPRRYCGKCRYNLHGLDTNVCPECGAKLQN